MLVPFTVKAFQPRHDWTSPSLFDSKPTSTKHRGPALLERHFAFASPVCFAQSASLVHGTSPHEICLSIRTLHVSQVSCAVAVSVF